MAKEPTGKERRRAVRLDLSWPVRYSWYSFSGEKVMSPHDHFGVAKNFGHKGICFVTEDPPPKGALLELKVTIPEKDFDFEALACVIWIKETDQSMYQIGAEIFSVDDIGRREIDLYLEKSELPKD